MFDTGYLYVLINPSMQGMVKVGKTDRDPQEHVSALSAAAGVPTPFMLIHQAYFENATQAEALVHAALEERGFRVRADRDFFTAPVAEVIGVILNAQISFTASSMSPSADPSSGQSDPQALAESYLEALDIAPSHPEQDAIDDLIERAEDYDYGSNGKRQDYREALKLYQEASKRGSGEASERLGDMYRRGDGCKTDQQKALEYYKLAVTQGNERAYASLGSLFFDANDKERGVECWGKFLEAHADPAGEHQRKLLVAFLQRYLMDARSHGLHEAHLPYLAPMKQDLLDYYREKIERLRAEGHPSLIPYEQEFADFVERHLPSQRALAASARDAAPSEPPQAPAKKPWWRLW